MKKERYTETFMTKCLKIAFTVLTYLTTYLCFLTAASSTKSCIKVEEK